MVLLFWRISLAILIKFERNNLWVKLGILGDENSYTPSSMLQFFLWRISLATLIKFELINFCSKLGIPRDEIKEKARAFRQRGGGQHLKSIHEKC